MRDHVVFYLNGKKREVRGDVAGMMLADYLRYEESLTGTKIVCAEGDCGACTVLRRAPGPVQMGEAEFLPFNSCVSTVAQMDGSSLVTIDELNSPPAKQAGAAATPTVDLGLTPVQSAMMKCHGSQCGFCTPGFVMAMTGLVEKKLVQEGTGAKIGEQEAKNALTGNLCRCTGYQPIIDAAVAIDLKACAPVSSRFVSVEQGAVLAEAAGRSAEIRGKEFTFHAPATLVELAAILEKNPQAKLVSGGTDLGVVHNKRKARLTHAISAHLIPELREITQDGPSRISVGANVTLSELRRFVAPTIPEFARFLDLFASPQIKNVATLAGNVCNASPIGDTPPFMLVAGAQVTAFGAQGTRLIPIEKFYLGYRQTALQKGEAVIRIEFDIPAATESLGLYKVSNRKDLDISSINGAFRVEWANGGAGKKIESIRIAMGGIAATPLRFPKTEAALQGADLTPATITIAVATLQSEMTPLSDLRGTAAFRRVVAENLLRKFFREHVVPASAEARV